MDKFKEFFDDFVFHARVMPILTAMFPIIVFSMFKGFVYKDFLNIPLYFFIILIFIVLSSKVARERGKTYESKMYRKLGGKPTTIILRYTDCTIDNITKTRYHKVLNDKISDLNLPLNPNDENEESDEKYSSAMTYLRKYANSNQDVESRVYQELKEYNYWRNLYGCKWISIIIYFLISVREIIIMDSFSVTNIFLKPYPEYIAFLLMIAGIFVMLIVVNKNTVERRAFDYAKALAEICEVFN